MAYAESAHGHDDHHDHTPGFFVRWFLSTNHKDIGTLYLVFSVIAALIGGGFSMWMRAELMHPGVSTMTLADGSPDGHFWNVVVTAHGLIMVFFRCHACFDRWVRQLDRAHDDWRAGYGLPTHEQYQLLAAGSCIHAAAGLCRYRRRCWHRLDDLSTIVAAGPGGHAIWRWIWRFSPSIWRAHPRSLVP